MFPQSRAAWRLLNGGLFALVVGILGTMVFADPEPFTIVIALLGLGLLGLFLMAARAARDNEEAAALEHPRRAAADPLLVIGEDLEQVTESLRRWASWLGIIALALAVMTGMGACSGELNDAKLLLLSAATWFALAAVAWYVRVKLSRVASLVLV